MCQDPKKIRDHGSSGSRTLKYPESYAFIFSWGLRDLWSCRSIIVVGSEGYWISDRNSGVDRSWGSWILLGQTVMGSCRFWILHINDTTESWRFFISSAILFPVSHISVLLKLEHLLRISTTYWFNHSVIAWTQAHLVGLSKNCHVKSMLLMGCGIMQMNARLMGYNSFRLKEWVNLAAKHDWSTKWCTSRKALHQAPPSFRSYV